jgi:MarR family transcriptional regulator, organic hydroperoxide resistance regulator
MGRVCQSRLARARRLPWWCYRPLLKPLGLTHPQYLLMIALWQHAPVRMRELARLLTLDSGTLSPLLTRLEAAGLITREKAPDNRSVTVNLTDQGRQLRESAATVPHAVMQHLGMEMEELTALHDRLLALITAANRAPD